MKFTVAKSELMPKLSLAMGTVSNKNTVPSIEGVLIETMENNQIQISTYDMNKGYKANIDCVEIEEEGRYIINAQRFYQTIKVLPDDDITISVNSKMVCEIDCGKAHFSMVAVLNGKDFPNLPDLITERGFVVSSEVLRKMISKVSHSIAEGDTRPMLCGAYFKISAGAMDVVSCDGYTLSKCKIKCDISSLALDGNLDYSFIIPGHALGELSKVLLDGEEENVDFYLSRKHAIIRKKSTSRWSRE